MGERGLGVGLLGLGVVGSGVAQTLILKRAYFAQKLGLPLELRKVLVRDPNKSRDSIVDSDKIVYDAAEVFDDGTVNIIVEVMGGETPAHAYIERALTSGKYVVTANKEVIAKHGWELAALAHENKVDLLYEASVGGGIPIITPLRRDLLANRITAIRAIINGTTNYILTSMGADNADFSDALQSAQALGYAEADPSNDIQGTDAAYKLAILGSLAFQVQLHPDDVYREGIDRINARDFRYAAEFGYSIKLLAVSELEEGLVRARVHPVLIPTEEPLAKVGGVLNAVQVEGDLLGRVLFEGPGAGSLATASAVVSDIVEAARRIVTEADRSLPWHPQTPAKVQPISELQTRYYLRMEVQDNPGVLATIASTLGQNRISIASVIQKETNESAQTAEIVIMTHSAKEQAVQQALKEMRKLEVVKEIGNLLRVQD